MIRRSVSWINTPVIMEAMHRYEENRLPRSMRLWLEKLLEIKPNENSSLLN
ncbi:hypothetical protein EV05_1215 [Prochlorococcus sp. MIT 0601]|nr:hypothetical protein EV05_1215 [Prochlorococcus sp. MIT 0601]